MARTKKLPAIPGLVFVSELGSQRPPVVGAWSVNPRHAVVSLGVGWRYMASSDTLSASQPDGLAGSPKAGGFESCREHKTIFAFKRQFSRVVPGARVRLTCDFPGGSASASKPSRAPAARQFPASAPSVQTTVPSTFFWDTGWRGPERARNTLNPGVFVSLPAPTGENTV